MTSGVELPLHLERERDRPLLTQLVEQLRAAIHGGAVEGGARLPSSRALAATLGISRNLGFAAYDELYAEGYVEGRHGSGTYVGDGLRALGTRAAARSIGTPRWRPSTAASEWPMWARSPK